MNTHVARWLALLLLLVTSLAPGCGDQDNGKSEEEEVRTCSSDAATVCECFCAAEQLVADEVTCGGQGGDEGSGVEADVEALCSYTTSTPTWFALPSSASNRQGCIATCDERVRDGRAFDEDGSCQQAVLQILACVGGDFLEPRGVAPYDGSVEGSGDGSGAEAAEAPPVAATALGQLMAGRLPSQCADHYAVLSRECGGEFTPAQAAEARQRRIESQDASDAGTTEADADDGSDEDVDATQGAEDTLDAIADAESEDANSESDGEPLDVSSDSTQPVDGSGDGAENDTSEDTDENETEQQ